MRRSLRLTLVVATAFACLGSSVVYAGRAEAPVPQRLSLPPCTDVPKNPAGRVACHTRTTSLFIANEAAPVLVGGTMLRVFSAKVSGSGVNVRMRVRNETEAEQGLGANGQALYLAIGGERAYAVIRRIVRLPRDTGKTVTVRFALTPAQLEALRAAGGRVDLGVRPWHRRGYALAAVGIVRVRTAG